MARLRAERASLLVLVLGAFALRMALLQDQSLWPDEGISWYLAVRPEAFPQADHPPLYFLALAGWVRLAGDSVLALRFFSVLPDVLLVAFLWRWGRRLGSSPAAGWGAALLWAASPLAVWYATEVRGYTWLALFGMLASYLLFIGGRPATYFLAGAAALLVHPFAAFLLGGHGWILWARWRCGNLARRWVGAWLSLPLAMIPWAVQAVRQMGNPTYWPGAFDPGEAVLGTLGTWVAGPSWAGDPTARQVGMALLAVAALGAWAWAFRQRWPLGSVPAGWALWGLLGFPLLGAGALAFVWPKYAPRYLMFLF
ncbi:MAG: glycosyltransferase family 39 protein, partial [Anaerolineae bacterium]|nr:glycosyltransferase family 39 protein [Anaerolineae bacterium]